MKRVLPLPTRWRLTHFDGYGEMLGELPPRLPEALDNLPWIEASVPGSVYGDLMAAGWLDDIYADCNTLAAEWVAQHYWYYQITFTPPAAAGARRRVLVFDGLDLDADVWLNGVHVASHGNVFLPLRLDVTALLRDGVNDITVRLSSGLVEHADDPAGRFNQEVTATLSKRPYLRKPQFAARWDWAPRLMNVGIGGGVWLEDLCGAQLGALGIETTPMRDTAHWTLAVRAVVADEARCAQQLRVRATVEETGRTVDADVVFAADAIEATCPLSIELRDPQLWSPAPHGSPHRYGLHVQLLDQQDGVVDERRVRFGVRMAEIVQGPTRDGQGERFQLAINGRAVFCKGGNWVPADLLYSQPTDDDYRELVSLALEAGYNFLRIWGGGCYAPEALLDACDEAGILVWHDLMFACTTHPADDPDWTANVEQEVKHQVRRMAWRPCVVLWAGNNEIDMGVTDGWIASRGYSQSPQTCYKLFHHTLRNIVRQESAGRPYWPTTPWSPDGSHPNHPLIGNQHPWEVALQGAKGDYWRYLTDASRFANEGGMMGASTLKTLRQILPEGERRVGGRVWMHHDNTQNNWRREPLLDNLLRINLVDDPRTLTFEDYARYSAILQGEAIATAIDNWRRRMWDSAAAVFWMFNDCWPATVSWTPIDHYRRRKPLLWSCRRAFAPLRPICVALDDELLVFVVNDHLTPQPVELRYGVFTLAGAYVVDQSTRFEAPANDGIVAARLPLSALDGAPTERGAFAVMTDASGGVQTHRLFRARFKELNFAAPDVRVTQTQDQLSLVSDAFAWAVCLDEDGERPLADNYFDLLPGVEKRLAWPYADAPTVRLGTRA